MKLILGTETTFSESSKTYRQHNNNKDLRFEQTTSGVIVHISLGAVLMGVARISPKVLFNNNNICLYVSYSWLNYWTEWADICLGIPWLSHFLTPKKSSKI